MNNIIPELKGARVINVERNDEEHCTTITFDDGSKLDIDFAQYCCKNKIYYLTTRGLTEEEIGDNE